MLSLLFSLALTIIWGAFAWCSLCLASADDPTSDDHEDPDS